MTSVSGFKSSVEFHVDVGVGHGVQMGALLLDPDAALEANYRAIRPLLFRQGLRYLLQGKIYNRPPVK